ncbi:MAG: hypothetical protein RLZZ416_623 [Candidatus Parcubacteria bacterium]|jgi:DNA-3-methyladenine glycosylase
MRKKLGPAFFDRPTLTVARDLLGKYLVRQIGKQAFGFKIAETEAYFGFQDKGSHAHRKQTPRNTPMFGPPGTIYVYFTYGMHWMLNLVCERKDFPAAVLIRGLESVHTDVKLDGPAKVTKHLGIDKSLSGMKLGRKAGLWVEDRGERVTRRAIVRTPRIGIPGRGTWTDKPWRFVLKEKRGRKITAR